MPSGGSHSARVGSAHGRGAHAPIWKSKLSQPGHRAPRSRHWRDAKRLLGLRHFRLSPFDFRLCSPTPLQGAPTGRRGAGEWGGSPAQRASDVRAERSSEWSERRGGAAEPLLERPRPRGLRRERNHLSRLIASGKQPLNVHGTESDGPANGLTQTQEQASRPMFARQESCRPSSCWSRPIV